MAINKIVFDNIEIEIPRNISQLQNDSGFITLSDIPNASNAEHGLIKIASAQEIQEGNSENTAVTPKQLKTAIDGIGTVFDLKGSVETLGDLPTTNNSIGDVWYVKNESVGYIWLNDGDTERWEQLGPSVDLSGYIQNTDIVNNLESTNIDKVLSAYQGNLLNQKISNEITARETAITQIEGKIPTKTSQLVNDSGFITSSAIPTALSQLSQDETHRLVTDTEKTDWNAKANDNTVVHKTGDEEIGGTKWFKDILEVCSNGSSYLGKFQVHSTNGCLNLITGKSVSDGDFFVNSKAVLKLESYTRTSGAEAWALRFSNGIQICWGSFNKATNVTVTFTLPFVNTLYKVCCQHASGSMRGNYTNTGDVRNKTTTNFQFDTNHSEQDKYDYIAIGAWQ
jgi:hypothetical protein|nr:MAG TPA: putative tail fiber protein [Caudoviricetes sp.]